jgi:hypothetical protein
MIEAIVGPAIAQGMQPPNDQQVNVMLTDYSDPNPTHEQAPRALHGTDDAVLSGWRVVPSKTEEEEREERRGARQ